MCFPDNFVQIEKYPSYAINKQGQVYSSISNKILKPSYSKENKTNYPSVVLKNSFGSRSEHIHRLLCLTFIPNPENKEQVNHKDGNRSNYNLDNLEWVTRSENSTHSNQVLGNNWHNENSRKRIKGTCLTTGKIIIFESLLEATKNGFIGANAAKCARGERQTHYNHTWEFISAHEDNQV